MTAPQLCECGCQQPVPLATRTDRRWGKVKGRPLRFIPGHNLRCIVRQPATAASAKVGPAKVGPDVRRCRRCPYPLVTSRRAPAGWRRHGARGLCEACRLKATATGELIDFERLTRSRDDILDEWALLRVEGYTMRQAAERLGIAYTAFEAAYYRARRDGDPRALPALRQAS